MGCIERMIWLENGLCAWWLDMVAPLARQPPEQNRVDPQSKQQQSRDKQGRFTARKQKRGTIGARNM
jgi:hypothetical protein